MNKTNQAWLLGDLDGKDFTYTLYEMIRPRADDRWCVRRAEADVTVCGRHVDPGDARQEQVYVTCCSCGETLVRTGQAIAVPLRVAHDAAVYYWRHRNETALLNRNILNRGRRRVTTP